MKAANRQQTERWVLETLEAAPNGLLMRSLEYKVQMAICGSFSQHLASTNTAHGLQSDRDFSAALEEQGKVTRSVVRRMKKDGVVVQVGFCGGNRTHWGLQVVAQAATDKARERREERARGKAEKLAAAALAVVNEEYEGVFEFDAAGTLLASVTAAILREGERLSLRLGR